MVGKVLVMILILGGTGYVGEAYQRLFTSSGLGYKCLSRAEVDYTNPSRLADAVAHWRPALLINAAGFTGKPNVDACERNRRECHAANVTLPARIAAVCADRQIPWRQVSSGCIYTGRKADETGFAEHDPPNFTFRHDNCSYYSGTKVEGEEGLRHFSDLYIWRLQMPFSHRDHPRNYLTKVMRYERLLEAAHSLSGLDEFAAATIACWRKGLPFGTYHVTNPGFVTTREVVGLIENHGLGAREFKFFADEAEFMRSATRAPRSSCVLDSSTLAARGVRLTEVHEAIDGDLRGWRDSPPV